MMVIREQLAAGPPVMFDGVMDGDV